MAKTVNLVRGYDMKIGGKPDMRQIYSDGTIVNCIGLPSKLAKNLEEQGYKMTKLSYWEYIGIKEDA